MVKIVNVQDFLKFPVECLKLLGVTLTVENVDPRWKRVLAKTCWIIMTLSLVAIIGTTLSRITDLKYLTETFSTLAYTVLAYSKLLCIQWRKKDLNVIIQTLEKEMPQTKEDQDEHGLLNCLASYKRRERFQIAATFSYIIFYIVPLVKFCVTGDWIQALPLDLTLPFDVYSDARAYTIAYFYEFCTSSIVITSIVGTELLLFSLISLVAFNFSVLSQRIGDLMRGPSANVHNNLEQLLQFHESLIRVSQTLQNIFGVTFLVQFIGSSITICLTAYQLATDHSIESLVKFVPFLVAIFIMIFMLCYYGSKLEDASAFVGEATYMSQWEEIESIDKKLLVIIIARSQKPLRISAYKFSEISLKFFTTVS